MRKRGRIILMAGRAARPDFPLGAFYTNDLRLIGFAMFNASPGEQRECAEELNEWASDGVWKPVIGRTLPLSEAAAAHRLQEENTLNKAGTLTGKIVVTPQ
jgi:NADPH2:quinone reductase